VLGDAGAHVETRDDGLRVLLQVVLAALPKHGDSFGGEAGVGIANDAVDAVGLEGA